MLLLCDQLPEPIFPPPTVSCMDKDDVKSFGVLACEVVNARFLEAAVFLGLLSSMEGVWRELHPLITSCVPSGQTLHGHCATPHQTIGL